MYLFVYQIGVHQGVNSCSMTLLRKCFRLVTSLGLLSLPEILRLRLVCQNLYAMLDSPVAWPRDLYFDVPDGLEFDAEDLTLDMARGLVRLAPVCVYM